MNKKKIIGKRKSQKRNTRKAEEKPMVEIRPNISILTTKLNGIKLDS